MPYAVPAIAVATTVPAATLLINLRLSIGQCSF
jgi:hypothetical protein